MVAACAMIWRLANRLILTRDPAPKEAGIEDQLVLEEMPLAIDAAVHGAGGRRSVGFHT